MTGVEDLTFLPDKRICELVFRLWTNKPALAQGGTSTTITAASVDGRAVTVAYAAAGGSHEHPTLASLPLASCVSPGTAVKVRLAFGVTLGEEPPERVGRSTSMQVAWLGSAFPLLAWEHGAGWMRDPAVQRTSESVGSEDFALDLRVTAQANDIVQGEGTPLDTSAAEGGGTVHHFTADAVRDVAIAVGALSVRTVSVGSVQAHVALPRDTLGTIDDWVTATRTSLTALRRIVGPFPYEHVWVTIVPSDAGGAIEFPGATLVGDLDVADAAGVLTHELGHSYFYGLVGNNQGRDPWLDEAFATWVSAAAMHQPYAGAPEDAHAPIGKSMVFWQSRTDVHAYFANVYLRGAYALQQARTAVGEAAFDAAIRDYLARNAHRIARPEDLISALRRLPKAVAILRSYGAFSR